jgi:alkyl sulfatase BDS1-like metallo-beta-lactamase superfamily hydrolase
MLTQVKRAVAGAPTQVSDRIAGLVGNVPDRQLEQLMQSQARRVLLDVVFSQMPRRLHRTRAAGVDSTVRWRITRPGAAADVYQLEIVDGRCRVVRGTPKRDARVTITIGGADFLRLILGTSDAMQAYFSGRLELSGDIMHAAKLTLLFRTPRTWEQRAR